LTTLKAPAAAFERVAFRFCKHLFTPLQREEHMMWRLVFGPSRFCVPDAMFLGEGARQFGSGSAYVSLPEQRIGIG